MQPLKEEISRRINAENAIQDLVSIIRELVENSIDAGSTSISVLLHVFGTGRIEVSDNGHGIHKQDFSKICQEGATSKLETLSDIDTVKSLGFRGQALFAISRLSKLTICTRQGQESNGSSLEFDNGQLVKVSHEEMNPGTIMKITDVFYNNPVRLNDLRNRSQFYLRKVVEMIETYSLIHYTKRISLTHIDMHNKRNNLAGSLPAPDLLSKLEAMLGQEISKNFKEYRCRSSRCSIQIIISNPQVPAKKKLRYCFLNKRVVDTPQMLQKVIKNCFQDFPNAPAYVLAIEMHSGYDINVAPDKRLAFFQDEKEIAKELAELLTQAAREMASACNLANHAPLFSGSDSTQDLKRKPTALADSNAFPKTVKLVQNIESGKFPNTALSQESNQVSSAPPFQSSTTKPSQVIRFPPTQALSRSLGSITNNSSPTPGILPIQPTKYSISVTPQPKISNLPPSTQIKDLLKSEEISLELNWTLSPINPPSQTRQNSQLSSQIIGNCISLDLSQSFHKSDFTSLSLIGQFNQGFIIAQKNSSLFIVDQHAADEKFLFETLQESTKLEKQPIIFPKQLILSPDDELLLENHMEAFSLNGCSFNFNPDKPPGSRYAITAFPSSKNTVLDTSHLLEMIENLKNVGCVADIYQVAKLIRPKKYRDIFASRACRKAVMIGTDLSSSKMNEILNNLSKLEHPWNCPHGRPTIRLLRNIPSAGPGLPIINFKLQEY